MGKFKKSIDLGGYRVTVEVEDVKQPTCGCWTPSRGATPTWGNRPVCPTAPMQRGGEGIMVAVEKPQRENYGGWAPAAESAFQSDLRAYHRLEKAAADCKWPNKMIDSGAIKWPVPQTNCVAPQPQRSAYSYPTAPCPCTQRPQRELRTRCGLPPIGARVVAHQWGEPVFDR